MLLPLTKGQSTIIDDEDWDKIKHLKWHAAYEPNRGKYTAVHSERINGQSKTFYLHRILMNCPDYLQVDHINRNTLDNRKCNLRICNKAENIRNTPNSKGKYKGVYLRRNGRYRAGISINNKQIWLGHFSNAEKAARAYNKAAKQYHGEFGFLNIIT